MIYTKKANFPYPMYISGTDDYINPNFSLDIDLIENQERYILKVTSEVDSTFITDLINNKKVGLFLIIKSKDNQFHQIPSLGEYELLIDKSKLSFYKNTTIIQLMIQSLEEFNFSNNDDLNNFYSEFKKDIIIKKGLSLGFSNIVKFDGNQEKPFALFEQKYDDSIQSDIEVELTREVITIVYKHKDIMLKSLPQNRDLTNPYLYMGLERALVSFMLNASEGADRTANIREPIRLDDISIEYLSPLDTKLYKLLKEKGIEEVDFDSIDNIIHLISDNMLKKFADKIIEVYNNGN